MEEKLHGPEQYLRVESAGGATWSPDGARVAYACNSSGVYHVYTVSTVGENVLQITSGENRCVNPTWLSDGSILYVTDDGGNENFALGIYTSEHGAETVSHDSGAKHNVAFADDSYVYFTANYQDRSRFDVYRQSIPLKMSEPELLFKPEDGLFTPSAVSENGRFLSITVVYGNMHQEIAVLDTQKKELQCITQTERGESSRWHAGQWIDESTIMALTDIESDTLRMVALSLDGTYIAMIDDASVQGIECDAMYTRPSDEDIYFTANRDGCSELYTFRLHQSAATDLKRIDLPVAGVVTSGDQCTFTSGLAISPTGAQVAVTLSSPVQNMNVWIIRRDSGACLRITAAGTAGLSEHVFRNCTLNRFSSFDGENIPYFSYIPGGEQPHSGWPALLLIHGGPEGQSRPVFTPEIQFFLSAGYAVIVPNIRGSAGYGRRYLDLDNVEKRLDAIADIAALARHVSTNTEIDGTRLAVFGGSYGGFAVLSAMTEYPDLWRAGIDIVGISNFETFLENTAPWRRKWRESEYGSLEHDKKTLKRISPIHQIGAISAPLFIIQGDNDERVPLTESIQIYEAVKSQGIAVELRRFADEGHGLTKMKNKVSAYSEVIEWLNPIMKGEQNL